MLEALNQPCVEIFQEYSTLSPSRLRFPLFSATMDEVFGVSSGFLGFFHTEIHHPPSPLPLSQQNVPYLDKN